jgi:multidrug efflux system outer membrane protein
MMLFPPAEVARPNPDPAPPQPAAFDLAGALARAKAENPLLKAARAAVEERRGLITATRADALPQVNVNGSFTRLRDDSMILGSTGQALAAFGLTPDELTAPSNVYSTQATLSQPLFYWGKLGTAIQVAKMGEVEAGYAYTTSELDTLHGVAKAYIGVLATQADLEVTQVRLQAAEQFKADVAAKLEVQSATRLDVLRAESEYLGVIPENLQAEADYKRAVEALDSQLNLDPRTPLRLADPGAPETDALPAPADRSEILQFRQQEQMYQANDRILEADLRPKLDFNASYGYQTSSSSDLGHQPYDTWQVNLTLKVPLFDGLRSSGKRAQNRAQLEQVTEARVDKERNVAMELNTSRRELTKAVALSQAADQAYSAALEALRTSREAFDQGLITSLDLLQAEREERSRSSQQRRGHLGVWTALFDYRRACGLPPL